MSNNHENFVEQIVKKAESQSNAIETSPFSSPAFDVLKEKISQFITELVNESIKISKRFRSDTISAAHVERACEYLLISSSRRIFRHIGTIGGILLGASISNILSMATAEKYTTWGTLLSVGFCVLGSFMIAIHIAKE